MAVEDKRVDIILNNLIKKRAFVAFDSEDLRFSPIVSYNDKAYTSAEELSTDVNYETIIVSDKACFEALNKAGYKVKTSNRKKDTVNISLNKSLIEKVRKDAYNCGMSVSLIIEQIVKEHYKE